MTKKVAHLLKKSREVILDCALENGAIVAANTDNPRYPKDVKDYRFVWPRDAAFILYAAKLLHIPKLEKRFAQWLLERAEGFSETGMLFQRYTTNGAKDAYYGAQYQPDQAGALLWALHKDSSKETKRVISLLAEGLYINWQRRHFSRTIFDLWEDRPISSKQQRNFSYTLASCSFGLSMAAKALREKRWELTSKEMKEALRYCGTSFYSRGSKTKENKNIDASTLGLVWPFSVVSQDKKLNNSLKIIQERLLAPEGVHRYERDRYDGSTKNGKTGRNRAGGWPLLTFWYVIALSRLKRKKEAREIFLNYIENFEDYIPEQLFRDKAKPSISPLAWSHAMFVVAAHEIFTQNKF